MQKSAKTKKATNAHRKVKASGAVKNRKELKRLDKDNTVVAKSKQVEIVTDKTNTEVQVKTKSKTSKKSVASDKSRLVKPASFAAPAGTSEGIFKTEVSTKAARRSDSGEITLGIKNEVEEVDVVTVKSSDIKVEAEKADTEATDVSVKNNKKSAKKTTSTRKSKVVVTEEVNAEPVKVKSKANSSVARVKGGVDKVDTTESKADKKAEIVSHEAESSEAKPKRVRVEKVTPKPKKLKVEDVSESDTKVPEPQANLIKSEPKSEAKWIDATSKAISKHPVRTSSPEVKRSIKISKFAETENISTDVKIPANIVPETPTLDEAIADVSSPVNMPEPVDISHIDAKMKERKIRDSHESRTRQSAAEMKEQAIAKAISNASRPMNSNKKRRTRVSLGWKRIMLALSCTMAIVFAIIYFVNISSPNISLKVAAMQSGIDASYPGYTPRGYDLSDITSENGKITLRFKEQGDSNAYYVLTEEKSSWDSSALETNYVRDEFGEDYSLVREQGLAIYIGNTGAAWVNKGIVFKLKIGSGTLTKKQIRAIAVSI